jgi:hypothetical protein
VHANTRATATPSGPCTGAQRRGLPTGHRSRPFRRGTWSVPGALMRIVAREECGCSRRIGSVQKDSAVSAVAAWGTHPFFTPLCPPRRYHLKDREKDVQEECSRRGSNQRMYPDRDEEAGSDPRNPLIQLYPHTCCVTTAHVCALSGSTRLSAGGFVLVSVKGSCAGDCSERRRNPA